MYYCVAGQASHSVILQYYIIFLLGRTHHEEIHSSVVNIKKNTGIKNVYIIPSSESSAYLKQIKCILSAVKKYRIFSLVTDTIFIFSL